jgi:putative phosphoribosyl transferase
MKVRRSAGQSVRRFRDRAHAGQVLAEDLAGYGGRKDVLVLALPRGGVEVGYHVALALACPLDVLVVRKIGTPGQEELALGAVATGDILVLEQGLGSTYGADSRTIAGLADVARRELARRERLYRDEQPGLAVAGKTVIVVDDGMATGATMRAAVRSLRRRGPQRIVVAVPVGPPGVCADLEEEADEVLCPLSPDAMWAVGAWYDDFRQTSDDQVRALLRAARMAA